MNSICTILAWKRVSVNHLLIILVQSMPGPTKPYPDGCLNISAYCGRPTLSTKEPKLLQSEPPWHGTLWNSTERFGTVSASKSTWTQSMISAMPDFWSRLLEWLILSSNKSNSRPMCMLHCANVFWVVSEHPFYIYPKGLTKIMITPWL